MTFGLVVLIGVVIVCAVGISVAIVNPTRPQTHIAVGVLVGCATVILFAVALKMATQEVVQSTTHTVATQTVQPATYTLWTYWRAALVLLLGVGALVFGFVKKWPRWALGAIGVAAIALLAVALHTHGVFDALLAPSTPASPSVSPPAVRAPVQPPTAPAQPFLGGVSVITLLGLGLAGLGLVVLLGRWLWSAMKSNGGSTVRVLALGALVVGLALVGLGLVTGDVNLGGSLQEFFGQTKVPSVGTLAQKGAPLWETIWAKIKGQKIESALYVIGTLWLMVKSKASRADWPYSFALGLLVAGYPWAVYWLMDRSVAELVDRVLWYMVALGLVSTPMGLYGFIPATLLFLVCHLV